MATENLLYVTKSLQVVTDSSHLLFLDSQLELIIPREHNIRDYKDPDDIPLTLKTTNYGEEHGLDANIQDSFLNLTTDQQLEALGLLQTQMNMSQAHVS